MCALHNLKGQVMEKMGMDMGFDPDIMMKYLRITIFCQHIQVANTI